MGFRFYKRIGGKAGFNLSKSGISASLRTRMGSIGTSGYSLRTGITGLFFRGTWGKGSRRQSTGINSGSCLGTLVWMFFLLFLIYLAIFALVYLLPVIVGAVIILGSYELSQYLKKRIPEYAGYFFSGWLALCFSILAGVTAFYHYGLGSDLLIRTGLSKLPDGKSETVSTPQNLDTKNMVAVPSNAAKSFTAVVEAKSSTMEMFDYKIVNGASVLLTSEASLIIAPSTNSIIDKNSQIIKLPPGTIAVIESAESYVDWYYVRAYEIVQKSMFDTVTILLGSGWLEAGKCRASDLLFCKPLSADFVPIAPKEIKDTINNAVWKCEQIYPSRASLSERKLLFSTSVYKYKGKRVSWSDPAIKSVCKEKWNDFNICTIKCSDLTASFEVSDKLATALEHNNNLQCTKILRIEGKIKTIDYWGNYFFGKGADIILEDVFILGSFCKPH